MRGCHTLEEKGFFKPFRRPDDTFLRLRWRLGARDRKLLKAIVLSCFLESFGSAVDEATMLDDV
jgi:hypothetical protein